MRTVLLLLAATTLTSACVRDDFAKNRPGSAYSAASRIDLDTIRLSDSVIGARLNLSDELRRFRENLTEPFGLERGAPSRQALVQEFVTALAAKDAKRLGELAMSRAEFAYVYYPQSHDMMARDGGMPPSMRWDLLSLASEKGLARALDRMGGQPLTLVAMDCPNPPASMGPLSQHDGCSVQLARADGTLFRGQLFGSILEQAGQFKFIGYVNDL